MNNQNNLKKNSLDKKLIKIVLLEGVSKQAVAYFEKSGYNNIHYYKEAFEGQSLIDLIRDAHIVGIRSRTNLNSDILQHCHKLIAIGCFCVGTNQVDLQAAATKGVVVFNAPYSNTRSVAELVIGHVISLMRKVPQANFDCHRGKWNKSANGSFEVRGKTLGIIGYGAIGRQVSVLAESLGLNVIFYDVVSQLSLGNACQVDNLKQLCQNSDIVTLHVPEDETTRDLINKKNLKYFKKGACLINASRGTVVNINDLVEALNNQQLSGAAIDAFPVEPKDVTQEFVSPLRQFENVILTPHIGGSTLEAQDNIGSEVAEKLVSYSDVGTTLQAVNFPQVSLPKTLSSNVSRILHIHDNLPGVLQKINAVFANNQINIQGQYLQSQTDIGYVVIDFENHSKISNKEIKVKLSQIEHTIICRILY